MPRPHIAPRYVNIEMQVVMDKTISPAAKQSYMYLKALACGAPEVTFSILEFIDLFGKPRTTMYRHLSLLATSAVLRYESPGGRTTGLVHVWFLVDPTHLWENPKNGTVNPKNEIPETQESCSSPKNGTADTLEKGLSPKSGTEKSGAKEIPLQGIGKMEVSPKNGTVLLSTSTTTTIKDSNNTGNREIEEEVEVEEEGGAGGRNQIQASSGNGSDLTSLEVESYPFKRTRRVKREKVRSTGTIRSEICIRILTRITGWFAYPGSWDIYKAEKIIWSYYQNASNEMEEAGQALERYLVEWIERGYNPTNPIWLTDWAATKFIPGRRSKKSKSSAPQDRDEKLSPVERMLKELNAADG